MAVLDSSYDYGTGYLKTDLEMILAIIPACLQYNLLKPDIVCCQYDGPILDTLDIRGRTMYTKHISETNHANPASMVFPCVPLDSPHW